MNSQPNDLGHNPAGESRRSRRVPGIARQAARQGIGRAGHGRSDGTGSPELARKESRAEADSQPGRIAQHVRTATAEGEGTPERRAFRRSAGVPLRASEHGERGDAVSPSEAGYRGEEMVARRRAKVEFAEGLEFSSPDDEFKLTFHNLTQVEYRAFPLSQEGLSPFSVLHPSPALVLHRPSHQEHRILHVD